MGRPWLSVCCLTRGPGPRVAAVLAPLREVADEIVIAADARVDDERLAAYGAVADRVLRVRFDFLERHLAWLHARCEGEWVLRLDDDEVVGPGLLRALPALVAAEDVVQYRIPRRWLYPDPGWWLDETPWSPDLQTRLVRTGALLRFPGELHTSALPAAPARVLEEPIYHLAHLVEGEADRRVRALRYELRRPGLQAPGGGPVNAVHYLPEDWSRRPPAPVPDEDRPAIAAVLAGLDVAGPVPPAPLAPRAEIDRHWAARPLADEDHATRILPLGAHHRLVAGERGEILVRIENLGGATWPWGLDQPPLVRPAHRWLDGAGAPVDAEHARTPLPADLPPGGSAIVPLAVVAPPRPGPHLLEVAMVHEGVRWFGEPLRIAVDVAPGPEEGVRPPRARRRRLRRPARPGRVPAVIHRVWLGDRPMPREQEAFGEGWARRNPGWEVRLWTDADVPALVSDSGAFSRARNQSERSDVLRYEILRRFGGVYADTDVECLRPFGPLIGDAGAVAGYEAPGRLGTALLGATPGHPLMERAVALVRHTVGTGRYPDATGPVFLTAVAHGVADLVRFSREVLYPYAHGEPSRRSERFPGAYAVHHWARSWGEDQPAMA